MKYGEMSNFWLRKWELFPAPLFQRHVKVLRVQII